MGKEPKSHCHSIIRCIPDYRKWNWNSFECFTFVPETYKSLLPAASSCTSYNGILHRSGYNSKICTLTSMNTGKEFGPTFSVITWNDSLVQERPLQMLWRVILVKNIMRTRKLLIALSLLSKWEQVYMRRHQEQDIIWPPKWSSTVQWWFLWGKTLFKLFLWVVTCMLTHDLAKIMLRLKI